MTNGRPGFGLFAAAALAALTAACGRPGDGGAETSVASAQDDAACAPDGELAYVCGLINAEDIVAVGNTGWLVASSLGAIGGPPGPGRIYLINAADKSHSELFPGDSPDLRHDQTMYPSCPGPLDLTAFDTHGLAVREGSPGVYRLYATSHGAVEAIQAFELDARGDEPTAAWVGCVPLPEGVWANSVAILEDGGFVVTKFMDPSNPDAFQEIMAGEINGEVYEWRPGGAVTAVPNTELSGPNGIELSPDGRFMYVAAFGGRQVARFDMSASPPAKAAVSVGINPDNLRWTPDGALLTVGGNAPDSAEGPGWSVYRINPRAMTAERIAGAGPDAALQGAATALQVGDEIWIGTFNGDRVGVLPAP